MYSHQAFIYTGQHSPNDFEQAGKVLLHINPQFPDVASPVSEATSPLVKSPRTERQTPHKGGAEDLEKIKEDSAESFLEVHNQDGMVLVVPLT